MRAIHVLAFLLVLIGGLNWGLVGLFRLNVIELIAPPIPGFLNFVYILVGVSAVYIGVTHVKGCRECAIGRKLN